MPGKSKSDIQKQTETEAELSNSTNATARERARNEANLSKILIGAEDTVKRVEQHQLTPKQEHAVSKIKEEARLLLEAKGVNIGQGNAKLQSLRSAHHMFSSSSRVNNDLFQVDSDK